MLVSLLEFLDILFGLDISNHICQISKESLRVVIDIGFLLFSLSPDFVNFCPLDLSFEPFRLCFLFQILRLQLNKNTG